MKNVCLHHIYYLFAIICLSSFLFMACENNNSLVEEEVALSIDTVHIAFAGGGWRAHTGHSGWIISLLDNKNQKGTSTLKGLLNNVGTISSNSGGSWFSTMLMFSDTFVNQIEAENAIDNWNTPSGGWLGKQKELFDAASCHALTGDTFDICVFRKYADEYNWYSIIDKIVFKDYAASIGQKTLDSVRVDWAAGKTVLHASTLVTSNVVLNKKTLSTDKQYYQACFASSPILNRNGEIGATCPNSTTEASPVTFAGIPDSSSLLPPPFFSEIGTSNASFHIGYTENVKSSPAIDSAKVDNSFSTASVPVIASAAASSAAGGFAASWNLESAGKVTSRWENTYIACDAALGYSLADSTLTFNNPSNDLSLSTLATDKFLRFADGGPVDNNGVAQLVRFLQHNKKAENFNIVAFDNVMETHPLQADSSNYSAGTDIANLFGKGVCEYNGQFQFCSGLNCTGDCVIIPDVQIFHQDTFMSTPNTWKAPFGQTGYTLLYTKYKVTTVNNPVLGISEGTSGTLHAFTCVWADAGTAPRDWTEDGDFNAYEEMLQFIYFSLNENNQEGLQYLKMALGLLN